MADWSGVALFLIWIALLYVLSTAITASRLSDYRNSALPISRSSRLGVQMRMRTQAHVASRMFDAGDKSCKGGACSRPTPGVAPSRAEVGASS